MFRISVFPYILRPNSDSIDFTSRFAALLPFTILKGYHVGNCINQYINNHLLQLAESITTRQCLVLRSPHCLLWRHACFLHYREYQTSLVPWHFAVMLLAVFEVDTNISTEEVSSVHYCCKINWWGNLEEIGSVTFLQIFPSHTFFARTKITNSAFSGSTGGVGGGCKTKMTFRSLKKALQVSFSLHVTKNTSWNNADGPERSSIPP